MPTPKLNELDNLRPALARIHQVEAAPQRHQQWCTNSTGRRICGGCLERWPCPDCRRLGIGRVTAMGGAS